MGENSSAATPILAIHPARARALILRCSQQSRHSLSTNTSNTGQHHLSRDKAREALFALAREKVPQFPRLETKHGKTCASSLFLSDAWAAALAARLDLRIQAKYG